MGHINHLYDDRDLTFGDIKHVMHLASAGKLERVTEKFDGMNIVFTMNNDGLRAARSLSDIKNGGLSADGLSRRFSDRGHVTEAFRSAFEVIGSALQSVPSRDIDDVFKGGSLWYSAEVVYPKNPNVIVYDKNNVIVHRWPTFEVRHGSVRKVDMNESVERLFNIVERMKKNVQIRSWELAAARIVDMKAMVNGSAAAAACARLDELAATTGCDDSSTLNEHLATLVAADIAHLRLPADVAAAVVDRVLENGNYGIPDIKRLARDANVRDAALRAVEDATMTLREHVKCIDRIIMDFAVDVLRCVRSTLVSDGNTETKRLKKVLNESIKDILASGDDRSMKALVNELSRLRSIDDVLPIEGIVFFYKGNAYKFTGAFAPINQILGIVRYQR